jgi:hypothetical protein
MTVHKFFLAYVEIVKLLCNSKIVAIGVGTRGYFIKTQVGGHEIISPIMYVE